MDSRPTDLLTVPSIEYSPTKVLHFESLFQAALEQGPGTLILTTAPYLTYEFLCYLVEHKQYLLHGSNQPTITRFEPRQQTDYEGRMVKAVFAAEDGIWPIFFAILDRSRYKGSLRNACIKGRGATGQPQTFYRFSINADLLSQDPWCEGTIYVLARDAFVPVKDEAQQPLPEWTSATSVQPLARVRVTPADFPFLHAVQGHDDRLSVLAELLFTSYEDRQELPDGYAFRYTWTTAWATQVLTFVELMRAAVPPVAIDLVCEPQQGPVWLRLYGSSDFKATIQRALEQLSKRRVDS